MPSTGSAYRLTGDPRYAEAAIGAILDWITANPPGLGIHWTSSLELAFRMLSWLWTLALCGDAEGPNGSSRNPPAY